MSFFQESSIYIATLAVRENDVDASTSGHSLQLLSSDYSKAQLWSLHSMNVTSSVSKLFSASDFSRRPENKH